MSNTLIQIKRSTVTNQPPALNVAEPAYSYSSNTLWLGTPDNNGVIPIGGKYYVDVANNAYVTAQAAYDAANNAGSTVVAGLAFDKANSANIVAAAAFDKANSANVLAYNTGIGANAYADSVGVAANNFLLSVIAGSNTIASAAFDKANSANIVAAAAFDRANTKLSTSGGTITGDLAIVGNLTVSGNTSYINVQNYRVEDPLIYLAGNNYVSDIVDIGFIANYVNATGSNVHTGIYREHSTKEYYIFQGYDQEPVNNHIDPTGNNFSLAVLNAHIRTSNLNLGGANAIEWITASFDKGNSAFTVAGLAFDKANSANVLAFNTGIGANAYADSVGVAANNFLLSVIAGSNTIAIGAFDKANAASAQASNADFITIGTLLVARGGTGVGTFTNNGVLFGNTTGAIRSTAAGTEGQVLQVTSQGTPVFGMLDGGSF